MSYDSLDTIAAVATAGGGAARGIVRVSGPDVVAVVGRCFEPADAQPTGELRRATAVHGHVHIALNCDPRSVPGDLFLWPTDHSYTREPVAELHTIGSPPLVEAVLASVCQAGARLAEPGEFTLRAFLAGRLDLTQAEAVLGVIDAHDQNELSAALAQLAGGLAGPLNHLRDELLQLLAELEAGLDFVEDDIRFVTSEQLRERLQAATAMLQDTIAQMSSRHTAAAAEQVVLFGPPNVGKSSLFNAMIAARGATRAPADAQACVAIVSDERGTTRDYLTAQLNLDGIACELVDTAGVQPDESEWNGTAASIGRAAQAMTAARSKRASIRVLCVETAAGGVESTSESDPLADLVVLTKADLGRSQNDQQSTALAGVPVIATSSITGQGLEALGAALRGLLTGPATADRRRVVAATADRCRDSLRQSAAALDRAAAIVASGGGDELVAAELRGALDELGRVVGAVYTDDLLDRIFKTFCIGK